MRCVGRLIEFEFEVSVRGDIYILGSRVSQKIKIQSVRGDIYILGSRVSQKIKIQSETRDFNFLRHSGTQYIYMRVPRHLPFQGRLAHWQPTRCCALAAHISYITLLLCFRGLGSESQCACTTSLRSAPVCRPFGAQGQGAPSQAPAS